MVPALGHRNEAKGVPLQGLSLSWLKSFLKQFCLSSIEVRHKPCMGFYVLPGRLRSKTWTQLHIHATLRCLSFLQALCIDWTQPCSLEINVRWAISHLRRSLRQLALLNMHPVSIKDVKAVLPQLPQLQVTHVQPIDPSLPRVACVTRLS